MDDEIIGYLAIVALFVVAAIIGGILRKVRGAADMRGLPDADRRMRLLAELRAMRDRGASHSQCLEFLQGEGLRRGVAEGMLIDLESEVPADVANPREREWGGYRFKYPGNWKAGPLDESLGLEHGLTVEGMGSSLVQFLPGLDDESFEGLRREFESNFDGPQITPWTAFAGFRGDGVSISGPFRKTKVPTTMRVIRLPGEFGKLIVAMVWAHEEEALVKPGFDLIESTFERHG